MTTGEQEYIEHMVGPITHPDEMDIPVLAIGQNYED